MRLFKCIIFKNLLNLFGFLLLAFFFYFGMVLLVSFIVTYNPIWRRYDFHSAGLGIFCSFRENLSGILHFL